MRSRISGTQIYLNVYDLSPGNYYLNPIGFGAYHTAIQIDEVQYSYGYHNGSYTGVCESQPMENPEMPLREKILIGQFTGGRKKLQEILSILQEQFIGNQYDLLSRNCNHFSAEFAKKLIGRKIPNYINRIATIGSFF